MSDSTTDYDELVRRARTWPKNREGEHTLSFIVSLADAVASLQLERDNHFEAAINAVDRGSILRAKLVEVEAERDELKDDLENWRRDFWRIRYMTDRHCQPTERAQRDEQP